MHAPNVLKGSVTTVEQVRSLDDLRDADGQYLAGTVNVVGDVILTGYGLERLPVRFGTVGGRFDCAGNALTTMEGAPRAVGGSFSCAWNRLASLEGVPRAFGSTNFRGNRLISLVGAHRILGRVDGSLYLWENEIVAGGIGLILVEGLDRIKADQPAFRIIERYLGQGNRGVLHCQEALHEAGLERFARL